MTANPFNIPEIRSRLACFVSANTALSCIQVSKVFSKDFIYPIWHTIDFTAKPTFENLEPSVVANNGRYIRVVKDIKSFKQLDLLLYINVKDNNLITIHLKSEIGCFYDLIRRNQKTLTEIDIRNPHISRSSTLVYLDSLTSMINQPQSSKLTIISIVWLSLTRSTLVSVLRCCPALKSIKMWGTTFVDNHDTDDFGHDGVTYLESMMSDTFCSVDRPILMHFPNLRTWSTYLDMRDSLVIAKDNTLKWCPNLISIGTNCTPSQDILSIISLPFLNVTCLTLGYKYMTQELVLEITRFPKWESIVVYHESGDIYEENQIYIPKDHFQVSSWMIQLILRVCHKLTEFDMTYHIMDMDEVEKGRWVCRDLKNLKVGIKGLDTVEMINATIDKYREGRRLMMGSGSQSTITVDDSIEARLAKHLLQFESLETIWFGTKIWSIKLMDFN